MRDVDNFPLTITLEELRKIIHDTDCAYDVDKVVEQIREQNGICNGCNVDEDRKCSIEKIISTVKGGIQ